MIARLKAMQTQQLETEVSFAVVIPEIPEAHRLEAEHKAKEAYVMTLLRHGDISSRLAARLLVVERWQVFDLMDTYQTSLFDDTLTPEDLKRQVAQTKTALEKYKG